MLPMYCLTGCDTVSFFFGHGKAMAFRLMMQHANKFKTMAGLGNQAEISKQERAACAAFVTKLYGKECESLDAFRCERAGDTRKNAVAKKLTPTDDSFTLHLQRVVYQLNVWKQASQATQQLPNCRDFGYEMGPNGNLQPVLMNQGISAPELLNDLICDCKDNECNETCICFFNNQTCTAACGCGASLPMDDVDTCCSNPFTLEVSIHAGSDDE